MGLAYAWLNNIKSLYTIKKYKKVCKSTCIHFFICDKLFYGLKKLPKTVGELDS